MYNGLRSHHIIMMCYVHAALVNHRFKKSVMLWVLNGTLQCLEWKLCTWPFFQPRNPPLWNCTRAACSVRSNDKTLVTAKPAIKSDRTLLIAKAPLKMCPHIEVICHETQQRDGGTTPKFLWKILRLNNHNIMSHLTLSSRQQVFLSNTINLPPPPQPHSPTPATVTLVRLSLRHGYLKPSAGLNRE